MYSLLILFFTLAIAFSFLCSLWEAVLLSITPQYAELRYQEGSPIGRHLRRFKMNIDRPLGAILTLNTIAHTVGAIGVGAQAAHIWAESSPLVTQLAIPAAMTLAILILSEIIPKTIGAIFWKRFAAFTVRSLLLIVALLAPFVWMSQLITKSLRADQSRSVFSRSDFLAMAELGAREGVFADTESEIIASLIRFANVRAEDIMTPRIVVKAAPEAMTVQSYFEEHEVLPFSRIPVYERDDKDHISGYILKDELLVKLAQKETDVTLHDLKREIMVITEHFPMPDLFSRFISRREQIAVVVDEFGGMSGIVTLEDVIETLLGMEIVDESDNAEDMQMLARKNWERRARAQGLIQELPVDPNDDRGERTPD